MATTQAATTHDHHKSPMATQQKPQGQMSGQKQLEQGSEASPSLQRYLGNSYVQALAVTESTPQQESALPPIVQEVLHSPGQPLDPTTRTFMESRFGADFSQVRVHTDPRAAQSARAVNARAYTVGRDIVFGANKYAPSSQTGCELLAHELAHTIQQRNAGAAPPSADPHGVVESSADAAGRDVANGRSVSRDLPACGVGLSLSPAPPDEIEYTAEDAVTFDQRKRTWRRHAHSEGQKDAARIRKHGKLSPEERQKINEKLAFFEGKAKEIYTQEITPALAKAEQAERREREGNLAYYTTTRQATLDHMSEEDKKLMRRRQRTIRFFAKIQDHRLEEAYRSRLQRYLDEGLEANEYWDLETIEQIVQQRAPNAPWREKVRQEFLRQKRLPTLPWYERYQLETLDKETQGWTTEERDLARDLLWQWFELRSQGHTPNEVKERLFRLVRDLYEQWLKAVDQQRLERCKTHPPSTLAKIRARAQGYEPCVSWFADKNQPGPLRLLDLERYMRVIDRGDDTVPLYAVHLWVREYRKRTNKELLGQAEYLQKATTIPQLGANLGANLGLVRPPAFGMPSPAPPQAQSPAAPPRVPGPRPSSLADDDIPTGEFIRQPAGPAQGQNQPVNRNVILRPRPAPPSRSSPLRFGRDEDGYFPHGVFRLWIPRRRELPAEGWKLHVSANPESSLKVANLVLPKLREMGAQHKVVESPEALATEMTGTQQGKFITIYPRDTAEARATVSTLDTLLRGRELSGPVVRGETPLGSSGLIYTRYGGITKNTVTDPSTGREVSDTFRGTDRPPWIEDPWGGGGSQTP